MSFQYEREYEVHLLLGDPASQPLWRADAWQQVFPILKPLASRARGAPITSSYQFEATTKRQMRFGRIAWNAQSQKKWTHQSDTTHRFLSMEVWAPSRGACAKDGSPPDFLFTVWNQGFFSQASNFRDTVLMAVPASDPVSVEACCGAANRLAELTRAKFHGRMKRPWARRFGAGFHGALGDMPTTGLFRIGDVSHQTPGSDILEEHWDKISARME